MNNSFKAVRVLLTTTTILSLILTVFAILNFTNLPEDGDPQSVGLKSPIDKPMIAAINEPVAASGAIVFKNNCKTCHRIDKQLVGPPLRDVYSRRDAQWLHEWIKNSSKMIANGDPAAVEVFTRNKNLAMTNFTSMTRKDLDAVIAYLKYVGENKDSNFD